MVLSQNVYFVFNNSTKYIGLEKKWAKIKI